MLPFCPICGGPLGLVLADKTLFTPITNGRRTMRELRAYSCGSNGHILILPAKGNGLLQTAGKKHASVPSLEARVLNSWKEIAAHIGRGVRTVQRWEQQLSLPIHRPRGRNRSPVLAFPGELDEWLQQTPIHAPTNGVSVTQGARKDGGAG